MATGGILGTRFLGDDELGTSVDDPNAPVGARDTSYNAGQTGVFARSPLMTPKYALNKGVRDAEFKETLARMYISLAGADPDTKQAYIDSLPSDDRIKALAKVLVGANAGTGGTGFIDFFLGQAQENFTEKMQVDEVLSDNYVVFYFGQQAPVFTYSGYLLNSQQDDQVTGFALAYAHLIRGTRLAQRGALLRLRYNGIIVSGTVNSMSSTLAAENELAVPFNFSMLVKEYAILRQPNFVKASPEDFVQLATAFDPEGLLTAVGQVQTPQVRTTTVLPTTLSSESVAGSDEDTFATDPTQPATEQLQSKVDQASQPAAPTSNVRGTLPANDTNLTPPDATMSLPNGGVA